MSDLEDWNEVIKTGGRRAEADRKNWQKEIGEPTAIYTDEDGYKRGMWKIEGGVLVTRIDKMGPNPTYATVFKDDFIEMLLATLRS